MVKTYALTHLALAVRDAARAARFYRQVFGAVEVYRSDGFAQLQMPGTRDVLVLEEKRGAKAGLFITKSRKDRKITGMTFATVRFVPFVIKDTQEETTWRPTWC